MTTGIRRVFITGGTGFVGRHLSQGLRNRGLTVLSLGGSPVTDENSTVPKIEVTDRISIVTLLQEFRPDAVVHLAAISSVAASWQTPQETIRVNVLGTLTLLDAVREVTPDAFIVSFGSGEEYGSTSHYPHREDDPTLPCSPYGVSKLSQGLLTLQLAHKHNLRATHLRVFNLIGPGQSTAFVASDWASQIVAMEARHRTPTLRVGNLDITRDFLDVRDACQAVCAILSHADPAPIYNLCSGTATPLRVLLETLLRNATVPIDVRVDPQRLRPADVPVLVGDPGRLIKNTGWQPTRCLSDTLRDTLNYWRGRHRPSHAPAEV